MPHFLLTVPHFDSDLHLLVITDHSPLSVGAIHSNANVLQPNTKSCAPLKLRAHQRESAKVVSSKPLKAFSPGAVEVGGIGRIIV